MATDTVGAQSKSAKQQLPSNITVLDELGGRIMRASALLRAAINTGPGERDDETALVDLAYDEIEAARKQYKEWAGVPEGGLTQ